MSDPNTNTDLSQTAETKAPYIPRQSGIIRCIDCEFKTSSKGNPMLVFEYEIVSPESINAPELLDGKPNFGGPLVKTITAGLKVGNCLVLNNKWTDPNLKTLHKAMGLPLNVNKNNPDVSIYKGKAIKCVLSTKVETQKQEGSEEALCDTDGKPLQRMNYHIGDILGGSPKDNVEMAF